MPDKVSKCVADGMSEFMSDRMSKRMSDRMAGSTRDKMPNEMVEYMSDLCQIECQNIYIYTRI